MERRQLRVLIAGLFFVMLALAMYQARVAGEGAEDVDVISNGDSATSDRDPGAQPGGSVHDVREGVEGIVVDASGKPLVGALIQPIAVDGSGPVPDMAVVTDADGRFVWGLRPGRYRLEAILEGRVVAKEELTVSDGLVVKIRLAATN